MASSNKRLSSDVIGGYRSEKRARMAPATSATPATPMTPVPPMAPVTPTRPVSPSDIGYEVTLDGESYVNLDQLFQTEEYKEFFSRYYKRSVKRYITEEQLNAVIISRSNLERGVLQAKLNYSPKYDIRLVKNDDQIRRLIDFAKEGSYASPTPYSTPKDKSPKESAYVSPILLYNKVLKNKFPKEKKAPKDKAPKEKALREDDVDSQSGRYKNELFIKDLECNIALLRQRLEIEELRAENAQLKASAIIAERDRQIGEMNHRIVDLEESAFG